MDPLLAQSMANPTPYCSLAVPSNRLASARDLHQDAGLGAMWFDISVAADSWAAAAEALGV